MNTQMNTVKNGVNVISKVETPVQTPGAAHTMTKKMVISVDKVNLAAFNPPTRTAPRALKQLRVDIMKRGIVAPVHGKLDGDILDLADGHRRTMIARELGIKKLDVIVHFGDESLEEIWAALNRTARSMLPTDWFQAWWRTENPNAFLDEIPKVIKGHINGLLRIYGSMAALGPFIRNNTSPHVVKFIDLVVSVTNQYHLKPALNPKNVGMWLIKHQMTGLVKSHFGRNTHPNAKRVRKLHRAVLNDKSLTYADMC